MEYDVLVTLENRVEEYAFRAVAAQANGAAWLRSGNNVILATVVMDETPTDEEEFLPLTVQYIEKAYAAGRIPGGFIKRETKPGDFETLTSRIIDRSLRPLFPKGFANPVQVTVTVLSCDEDADLQVLGLNAAAAALYVSDIDVTAPVCAMRVAQLEGKLIINPTMDQLKRSTLDLYLAGSAGEVLMIEMRAQGSVETELVDTMMVDPIIDPTLTAETLAHYRSNALSEERLIDILQESSKYLKVTAESYQSAFTPFQKPKNAPIVCNAGPDAAVIEYVRENHTPDIETAIGQLARSERTTALAQVVAKIAAARPEWERPMLTRAVEAVKRTLVRAMILREKTRADGRDLETIRPVTILTNVLPNAHASCLFTRGQTQALAVLTLGGDKDAQMYEDLTDRGTQYESFMIHYNFPGYCVGEASPIQPPRRRELGHGNLAKRGLEPTLIAPDQTIRIVSEILESNGSSSMATVCAGYMALRAADIETIEPVAGVAMGLVAEGEEYAVLTDILGLEDHDGDMDFKVAGTKDGITALQMDIKLSGVSNDVLEAVLLQARRARIELIAMMQDAESEIVLSEALPGSDLFHIDPDRVADVIGQAGKTIKEIIERFEVAVDIDKKAGRVKLTGKNRDGVRGARDHIEDLLAAPRDEKPQYYVGDVLQGRVKKIVDFGAFIELPGGVDGLLHISKISESHIENVADVLSEGDEITVKILEFKGSKISLGRP